MEEHDRRRGVPPMGHHPLAAPGHPRAGCPGKEARTPSPVAREGLRKDHEVSELEAEVERTSRALKDRENTLLRGKVNGV
jgi:hypothetical protein